MSTLTRQCDECLHFTYPDWPHCDKGHKPKFFSPTIAVDVKSWGYKRKCDDFKEKVMNVDDLFGEVLYTGQPIPEIEQRNKETMVALPPAGCINFNPDWLKPGALIEVTMDNIRAYHKEVYRLTELSKQQAQTIANMMNALAHFDEQEEGSEGTRAYQAWRRSEAYAVPVNDKGAEAAEKRRKQFNKGFYAGMRHAALVLELEHKKVKDQGGHHNYYGVASQIVRRAYMEDLSEKCTQTTDKS